jgi:sarcosine oxidase subunit alpha
VAGAHLFAKGAPRDMENDQGWVTSACYSPHLKSYIALAYLENGDTRMGETLIAANPLEGSEVPVEVVSPHFIDPEGGRLRD